MPLTLLLTRGNVASVLDMQACIAAVEDGFRAYAEGRTLGPASLAVMATNGGFHVKAAGIGGAPAYFAAKTNANFPSNPMRHGLPTIQGVIVLCDASDGRLLAVMDSIEITIRRTAAASAIAAKFLARTESRVATIIGCGAQAAAQIRAISQVLRLERILAHDIDTERVQAFTIECEKDPGIPVEQNAELSVALAASDVVITCTPSKVPFLSRKLVRPGTFIAAVGADNPEKSEIEPALMAASTVVVDIMGQCAEYGDLHHALRADAMTREDVYCELADLVSGRSAGRRTAEEVTIFDSTGTALQDLALATLAYERARTAGYGTPISFSD